RRDVPEAAHHRLSLLVREHELADGDVRAERMELELERGHDAEAAPAPARRPEQILVVVAARHSHRPVGGDDLHGAHVVSAEAVTALQVAHTAAEGEAGDAGDRYFTAGRGEPEQLGLPVDGSPGGACV